MRFISKSILVIIAVLVLWLGFTKAFESLKEKYLYRFIANRFSVYADKKWNANLYVGYVKGDIFRSLSLNNIVINDIKILPKGFEIKADSLNLTYPPFGLLYGEVDSKFQNLRLICKDTEIPVEAYQHKDTAVIVIRRNTLKLDEFTDSLPEGISLLGTIASHGEIVLKNLRPHLVNISVDSKDFELDYKKLRKIKGTFNLEAVGKPANANITGNIEIKQAAFNDGLVFLYFFKDLSSRNKFLYHSVMDIDIIGLSCKLKKDKDGKPYLLGNADIRGAD